MRGHAHPHVVLTLLAEDSGDEGAGDGLDAGDTLGVSESNTDLRGGHTLLGELNDAAGNILSSALAPGRSRALVGEGRAGDTLGLAVHTSHFRPAFSDRLESC